MLLSETGYAADRMRRAIEARARRSRERAVITEYLHPVRPASADTMIPRDDARFDDQTTRGLQGLLILGDSSGTQLGGE